jgi:hypothetical protein
LPAKRNIFLAPASYFEWLPARIQQRINALQQTPQTNWAWLKNYSLSVRYASLASFSVAIIAGIIWFKSPQAASNNTEILASISTQEAADYLQNNEISSSELIEFYAQSNAPLPAVEAAIMHNISAETAAEQLELESVNPEDLID